MAPQVSTDPTVLLVEDFHDDRQMYAEYLRVHRFNVIEVDNTGDAVGMAATADVIVTGIRVRGPFDGVELVCQLRANARTKRKPIIVLTACAFERDERRARVAGCNAFLTKPCLPELLITEIRRELARVSRAKPARAGIPPSRRRDTA